MLKNWIDLLWIKVNVFRYYCDPLDSSVEIATVVVPSMFPTTKATTVHLVPYFECIGCSDIRVTESSVKILADINYYTTNQSKKNPLTRKYVCL
jgi:hypothetical protein